MTNFETIDDAVLEQVKGGLTFSIGLDIDEGLSVESPLGSLTVPSPITIARDLVGTLGGAIGNVLKAVGNRLTKLGQLFDFS